MNPARKTQSGPSAISILVLGVRPCRRVSAPSLHRLGMHGSPARAPSVAAGKPDPAPRMQPTRESLVRISDSSEPGHCFLSASVLSPGTERTGMSALQPEAKPASEKSKVTVQVSRISPRNTRNTQNRPGSGHEVPEAFSRIWRVWRAPLLNSCNRSCARIAESAKSGLANPQLRCLP
jgi:hypothetical protein